MLSIDDLTFRLGARLLFDKATASLPRARRISASSAATAPARRRCSADLRRDRRRRAAPFPAAPRAHRPRRAGGAGRPAVAHRFRARGRYASAPRCWTKPRPRTTRIDRRDPNAPRRYRRAFGAGARGAILSGLGFDEAAQKRALDRNSPAAGACASRSPPCCSRSPIFCCSTSPPTISISKARSGWSTISQRYPATLARHQPRSRPARRCLRPHPASRPGEAHALARQLFELREAAARSAGASGESRQEAGGAAQASAGLRRPFSRQGDQGGQAQSRLKMLAKLEPVAAIVDDEVLPIYLPSPEKPLSPPIIAMERVSVGYGESRCCRTSR